MLYQTIGKKLEVGIVRPAIITSAEYLAVYVIGLFAYALGVGPWFSIILVLLNLGYARKLSEGKKRFVKQEFVPVVVTTLLALTLHDGIDILCAALNVVVVLYRIVELFS